MSIRAPSAAPSQREFKLRQRPHGDRIDMLRVEFGILDQASIVARFSRCRRLPIRFVGERVHVFAARILFAVGHRIVKGVCRRIVVDDVDAISARTGQEIFRGYRQFGSQNLAPEFDAGILGNRGEGARIRKAMPCPADIAHGLPPFCFGTDPNGCPSDDFIMIVN